MNHTLRVMATGLALLCLGKADAQNITGYRYWFNDDVAAATVVTLPATPVADASLTLNSASLPVGHHLVTLQFRDADGLWGAPWSSVFAQRSTTVNALEYWFNDEVGNTTTVNVAPSAAPLMTQSLATASLPVGFHTVTVRTVDGRGERSVPYTVNFTRNGGVVTGYEYWLDDAFVDRTSASIGPAGTVDLIAALPVPTTEGDHLFTIRFRDTDGEWSVPLSSTFNFFVGLDEIAGVSNYLLFPNPANEQLSLRVDASVAEDLHIQVLDASGRMVQNLQNWNVSGNVHRSWDIHTLAPGNYLLRIASADRSFHMPFVKQ